MAKSGSNIYKRNDGRYEGRIMVGKTIYRKPHYIYVYARTLKDLKQKMQDIQEKVEEDYLVSARRMRDAANGWLEENRAVWKATTYDRYEQLVRHYIIPVLGSYQIHEISRKILAEFTQEIDRLSPRGGVSERYKKYICTVIRHIIIFESEKADLDLTPPPLPDIRVAEALPQLPDARTLRQMEEYLMDNLDNDTCLGILVARYTGIRIGELCALQWKDIDLDEGALMIHSNLQRIKTCNEEEGPNAVREGRTKVLAQLPKTARSIRVIPLPARLTELLRQHRRRPEEYLVPGKKAAWTEVRTMQYRFASILKKSGIEPFHFHLLRHNFASECIRQGCDMKSLSEILGHSNIQITMSIYVHTSMQQKKKMMNLVCRRQEGKPA